METIDVFGQEEMVTIDVSYDHTSSTLSGVYVLCLKLSEISRRLGDCGSRVTIDVFSEFGIVVMEGSSGVDSLCIEELCYMIERKVTHCYGNKQSMYNVR